MASSSSGAPPPASHVAFPPPSMPPVHSVDGEGMEFVSDGRPLNDIDKAEVRRGAGRWVWGGVMRCGEMRGGVVRRSMAWRG